MKYFKVDSKKAKIINERVDGLVELDGLMKYLEQKNV
jgi:hypothetical protein